jgi:peptide/nickel transport system permease protein
MRNALLPVMTVTGLQAGRLLAGAILTETIFSWPGIGLWIFEAIQARDYPIVQGATLFIATIFVLVNLLTDLCYAVVDPRIRYD